MKKLYLTAGFLLLVFALPLFGGCGHRHSMGDWKVSESATCSMTGTQVRKCTDCGEVLDSRSYTVEHSYDDQNICIYCGKSRYGAESLEYAPITIDGKEGYMITGRGNCAATLLEIPATYRSLPVLAIGDRVFYEDPRLSEVRIPKNILRIGESAFAKCEKLKTVTFTGNSGCTTIGESAFLGCSALTAFTLPTGVTEIAPSLFSGCAKLKTLTLHSNLIAVGDDAFEGCDRLTLAEKDGIQYLGSADDPHIVAISVSDRTITVATLAEGTKLIYAYAFAGCHKLQQLTLPDSVVYVGGYAFSGCSALSRVTLSNNIITIGKSAFLACSSLTEIILPAKLTTLSDGAFEACDSLVTIHLPTTLTHVGNHVFHDCAALVLTRYENGFYLGSSGNDYFLLVGYATLPGDSKHPDTVLVADKASQTQIDP